MMERFRRAILPVLALIFGVLCGMLRKRELLTAFDETELPIAGHPATMAVIIAAAAFVLLLAIGASLMIKGKGSLSGSRADGAVELVSGALLALSAGLDVLSAQGDMFLTATLFLSVLAGLCICCLGLMTMGGRKGPMPAALILAPVFCMSVRLIFFFKGWSADPVIVDYIYPLFSVILITSALFFRSGFQFGKPRPRLAGAVCLWCVVFSVMNLWQNTSLTDSLFYAFAAMNALAMSHRLLGDEEPEDEEDDEDETAENTPHGNETENQ